MIGGGSAGSPGGNGRGVRPSGGGVGYELTTLGGFRVASV